MKHIPVHHIHVKYGKEIFTISHEFGCIKMSTLETFIKQIKSLKNIGNKHEN